MNTFNNIEQNKSLNIQCKHLRRQFNIGQYWCAENHDVLHCDETCPYREEIITNDYISTTFCPHNIYK